MPSVSFVWYLWNMPSFTKPSCSSSTQIVPLFPFHLFHSKSAQEELVHAIIVNEAHKRIIVIFRGSVTQKDFIQDAKCVQKKLDMPIDAVRDHVESIRIHTGFYGA